jgi:hypothetical protein
VAEQRIRFLRLVTVAAVVTTLMVAAPLAANAAACVCSMSLSPTSGLAGASVTVSGAGWVAASHVRIQFVDSAGVRTTVVKGANVLVASDGTFSASLAVPSTAATGLGRFQARDKVSLLKTMARFQVIGYRPDAMIGAATTGPWVGNNVYNATGLGQTLMRSVSRGRSFSYWVMVQNDGTGGDTLAIKGWAAPASFTIAYRARGIDVTTSVEAGTYQRGLAPGSSFWLQVVVGVRRTGVVGRVFNTRVRATSLASPLLTDLVVASTKAK